MWEYLRLHEAFIRALLSGQHGEHPPERWQRLLAFHETQMHRMQNERLIHLIVTLFVATFFLLVLGFSIVRPTWPGLALTLLFLGLLSAYLVHYFRLENGVQRWYHLANEMHQRAGGCGARYQDGRVAPVLPERKDQG
jgi:hypothetical protein